MPPLTHLNRGVMVETNAPDEPEEIAPVADEKSERLVIFRNRTLHNGVQYELGEEALLMLTDKELEEMVQKNLVEPYTD